MTDKCEFKSAKELGLEQDEWEALITTLVMMENDLIVHVPPNEWGVTELPQGKHAFNMQVWNSRHDGVKTTCGSVCCIGGSAEVFGKLERDQLSYRASALSNQGDGALYGLFFDFPDEADEKQAAKALRGYLKTGITNWEEAME